MKMKLPSSVYNWVSIWGAVLALISFFMIIFLFAISFFHGGGQTYLGLVIYLILPGFLVAGLLLIPLGMWIKSKQDLKRGEKVKRLPFLDLNISSHRNAFMIFVSGTVVFLFVSAVGSYEAFNFTESVEFCGTLCHNVMNPEYTAYRNSPHARVRCVDCHVGEGADWYVRSKISGMYQVYAVLANVYPKPIETPINNLRPARETCEQCHWPQKFYARKLKTERHYLTDEKNSEWDINLAIKIGSSYSAFGLREGIHWHINPDVNIEYIYTDDKHQKIPWVKYTNKKTGKVTIYKTNNTDEKKLDVNKKSVLDCIGCHNRPSHIYNPPAFYINNAITAGKIPQDLPEIKFASLKVLEKDFDSEKEAYNSINSGIHNFYKENYAKDYSSLKNKINSAVAGIWSEFNKNAFPEMKVRWDKYPNNIGHVEFDGCFRCHDDNHVSESGKKISKDCNLCHSIIAQGPPQNLESASVTGMLDFKHPIDIGDEWKTALCTDCHTGLNP
ncbi:MAG: NapC/NirT family cytochrome c [Ignavibacteriales bacterium]